MPDPAEHTTTRASTTAGPAEVVVAVAAVLSRLTGTDRATLSAGPATMRPASRPTQPPLVPAVADRAWPRELVLPRTSSVREVVAALTLPMPALPVPARPMLAPPTAARAAAAGVTISATDPAGRRYAARVYADAGGTTWAWLADPTGDTAADPAPDPAADERVRRVLADPDAALSDLVLTDAERARHAALATSSVTGPGVNVVAELARHALAHPNRPAIVDGDGTLTYAELDRATAHWATRIAGHGVRPGDVVALILPRSGRLVVAVLGALRAGITFTIAGPGTPTTRLARLLTDAGARLAVADETSDLPLTVVAPATLVEPAAPPVPARTTPVAPGSTGNPPSPRHPQPPRPATSLDSQPPRPATAAYVLFTSGSTGAPKRVTISRRALSCYVEAVGAAYRLSPADRVLQLAEPGFDVMLEEILPTVAAGATLVVADPSGLASPEEFVAGLRRDRVTVLNVPSSLWLALLRDGSGAFVALPDSVRLVIAGSERVPAPAYLAWHRSPTGHVRLLHAYGTTETTITSLIYQPDRGSCDTVRRIGAVPIGLPLANTEVRIVDRFGDARPFGRPGELVIGGTSTHTSLDSMGTNDVHHTGDLVYLDRTGVVVHLGRLDGQLKVRGHRIEPAEVEDALESLPAVRHALCTRIGDDHDARLVAVVVPNPTGRASTGAALRADLGRLLPRWMIPDQVVLATTLPRNDHGKIDQAALRRLALAGGGRTGPRSLTRTERIVATCMSDVLGCPVPAAGDNFYALGGTSLLAIRLVLRLAERVGVELPARHVLREPTVEAIARAVDDAAALDQSTLPRRATRGSFPLTPSQQAMVRFLDGPGAGASRPYFEMAEAWRIRGPLDRHALRQALRAVVAEHEPLRTVLDPTTMTQRVLAHWVPEIHQVDLSDQDPAGRAEGMDGALERARRPFDLSATPAFRPVLIRTGATEHVLSLTFHHLFFDGWSYSLVYRRLAELYTAYATGSSPPERKIRPEFGDWALLVTDHATKVARRDDLEHWRGVLAGHRAADLCARITSADASCTASSYTVDSDISTALDRLAAASALTPFAVLASVFAITLAELLHHRDLIIASNDANRYEPGTDHIVGYLATSLLSRFQLRGRDSFLRIAGRTHAGLDSARAHPWLHWEDLVADLGLAHAVQFRFSLQDTPSPATLTLPGLTVDPVPDPVPRRGKRAVAAVAWRRPSGYELRWYARDDAGLVPPPLALRLFDTVLASVVAEPDLTVAELSRRLDERPHAGTPADADDPGGPGEASRHG